MLTEARGNLEDWQYPMLLDITTGVQELLAHPELIEGIEGSVESVRRSKAMSLTSDPHVLDRLQHAAAVYILAHEPETLVRHASLVEPAPRSGKVRVSVESTPQNGQWIVDIATHDMRGLLARICAVLAERGLEIVSADLATWPDEAVLDSFIVNSVQKPNAAQIAYELETRLKRRLDAPRRLISSYNSRLSISLDNDAHPWHSVIRVSGADQPGLVQAVATAFAMAKTNVHHAHISTQGDDVSDRFEVSTRHGRKLGPQALQRITELLS
jgi:UTP:GlnB (protein PII) uridylyltransferase